MESAKDSLSRLNIAIAVFEYYHCRTLQNKPNNLILKTLFSVIISLIQEPFLALPTIINKKMQRISMIRVFNIPLNANLLKLIILLISTIIEMMNIEILQYCRRAIDCKIWINEQGHTDWKCWLGRSEDE